MIKGEVVRDERKIKGYLERAGANPAIAPITSPNYYLWMMKGDKIRVDEIHNLQEDKRKTLEIYDGEKGYLYVYRKDSEIDQILSDKAPFPLIDKMDLVSLYYPLVCMGLYLNDSSLSDLLKKVDVKLLGSEIVGGTKCYVMDIIFKEEGKVEITHRHRLWIDPSKNFAVIKDIEYSPIDNQPSYIKERSDYQEYGQGIWIPLKCKGTLHLPVEGGKREPVLLRTIEFKKLVLNPDLNEEVFALSVPKGTVVYEPRFNKIYKVGEEMKDEDLLKIADALKRFLREELKTSDLEKMFPPRGGSRFDYRCGPNALLIACGIFEIPATSEELAKLSGTDEEGITSMMGLKKAAQAKGLNAEGVEIDLEGLAKELKKGKLAIAFLSHGHFILVAGFEGDRAIIVDPPTLLAVTPINILDENWDGRALLLNK